MNRKLKRLAGLSIEDKVRKTCETLKLVDPIVLLTGLANGRDITGTSLLYQHILRLQEEYGDEPPSQDDWLTLLEAIKDHARFIPVDEKTKLQAQRSLAEYLHNKKKAIELTDKTEKAEVTPLNAKEIKRFERKFKRLY